MSETSSLEHRKLTTVSCNTCVRVLVTRASQVVLTRLFLKQRRVARGENYQVIRSHGQGSASSLSLAPPSSRTQWRLLRALPLRNARYGGPAGAPRVAGPPHAGARCAPTPPHTHGPHNCRNTTQYHLQTAPTCHAATTPQLANTARHHATPPCAARHEQLAHHQS